MMQRRTVIFGTLLFLLPRLFCLCYEMFPVMNGMLLLVLIVLLLESSPVSDTVEYTRQEGGISDNLHSASRVVSQYRAVECLLARTFTVEEAISSPA